MKKLLSIILSVLLLLSAAPLAFAAELNVKIDMYDSYGDGWNDNAIVIWTLTDSGFCKLTEITLDSGSEGTAEVTLSSTGVYAFEWLFAHFYGECRFDLTVGGELVLAGREIDEDDSIFYVICDHAFTDGKCTVCGYYCGLNFPHVYSSEDGFCGCGVECVHSFKSDGFCSVCKIACEHEEYIWTANDFSLVEGSSGVTSDEDGSNLFDGDIETKWCSYMDDEELPYVIFSCELPARIISYTLTTANDTEDYPERNWINWTLYAGNSPDGEWTVIHDVTGAALPEASYAESDVFEVNAEEFYTYYKLVINQIGGGDIWDYTQQMAEMTVTAESEDKHCCSVCGKIYTEPTPEPEPEPETEEDNDGCEYCGVAHNTVYSAIVCHIIKLMDVMKSFFVQFFG